MTDAATLRAYFRLDVARLRRSARRLRDVDGALRELKRRLEYRTVQLRDEARRAETGAEDGPGPVATLPIRNAQAQATAELARRAALGEVLRHASALSLVSTMAVARWVEAVEGQLPESGGSERRRRALAKGHIDAGRIAHRTLVSLRRRAGLRSGCGQLACAVVVAELAPPDLGPFLDEQIEEGYQRALRARGVHRPDDALAAVAAALREGTRLLDRMVASAAPAAEDLLRQADEVEARVEGQLGGIGIEKPGFPL